MSGVVKKVAAASVMVLLVGLGTAGQASAAIYDDEESCAGTAAPQNLHTDNHGPEAVNDRVTAVAGTTLEIDVLHNDTDVDGDRLYIAGTTEPRKGSTCISSDSSVFYTAASSTRDYTDTFRYGITDGDRYRSATVTIKVEGVQLVKAQLKQRLLLKKNKKVKRKALVAFTNPNSRRVVVLAYDQKAERTVATRTISAGKTISFLTKSRHLAYAILLPSTNEYSLVNVGQLDTKTGSQSVETLEDEGFFKVMPSARAIERRLAEQ